MNKKNCKGGTENLRLKRNAEFKAAGNNPKQTKLSFGLDSASKKVKFLYSILFYCWFLIYYIIIRARDLKHLLIFMD